MPKALLSTPPAWIPLRFTRHYDAWRDARIAAIRSHYGDAFFDGRTLLELGCGYGDIGACFASLGAEVTCADARDEHLQVLQDRWPSLTVVRADLDREWPFARFDVILHLGVLYHLEPTHASLRHACRSAQHLVVESEVCDAWSPEAVIVTPERGYDQSFAGQGCRPSAARVERILQEEGMQFERVADARCNAGMHVYDWPDANTNTFRHGQRRFWFATKV